MISCVNNKSSLFGKDLEQFEEIQNHFGWSEGVTRTKIGTWQTKHNTSDFPTIEEMKQYENIVNKEKAESTGYTQEMISIKNKAVADGTFMKAPNGKPTNLTERQWLQVRTKAFKEWFGDWTKQFVVYQGRVSEKDGRKFNYYTISKDEASSYGSNVESKIIDTTGMLSYFSDDATKLREEFYKKTGKRFDILNNSKEGLQTQNEFFEFIQSKGYTGFEYLSEHPYLGNDFIENPYIVEFDNHKDPNNISKVVDGNGEPLVVYHGTIKEFDTFNTEYIGSNPISANKGINKIRGFFFTSSYNSSRTYGRVKEVFLNIKNPVVQKQEYDSYNAITGINPDGSYIYTEERYGIKTFEDLSNIKIESYNDGIIAEDIDDAISHETVSITDPRYKELREFNETLYGNDYVVFNPNQIKSATDNIGTFSRENNDIRYNQNLQQWYYSLLDLANKITTRENSIHSLKDFNDFYGTDFKYTDSSRTKVRAGIGRINRVSVFNANDLKVSAKRDLNRLNVINYLTNKFNLKLKELNDAEYEQITNNTKSNCCIKGDTVYLRANRNLTNEQIIEEFLHPLVHDIYASDYELSNNLLAEAKKNFPDLNNQIELLYKNEDRYVRDEELITQVLAKYLNREISDNGTNTRDLADYIKQFFEKIFDRLRDLFGNISINKTDRLTINGTDIEKIFSFENLAQLINTQQLRFNDELPSNEIRNNIISEEFYIKRNMLEYVDDLVADGIKKEDITINHVEETEDSDEYWTVSYNQPIQEIQEPQQPIKEPEKTIDTHQEKATVNMTLDRQMKQVWNPTVLRSRIIRFTQIFKDIVTKLENELDDKEKLSSQAATRQYIIAVKYGAKNILDRVKKDIQDTYANKEWVENFVHDLYDESDWNNKEVVDKIEYIYQQGQYMIQFFEPLVMEASTEIKRTEKVSLLTNDGELTQDDFEEENVKDEEDLSKHEEGWFFENHEQSVESMLSGEVKSILSNLYEKDSDGFLTQFDDLEQPIPIDYRIALGTCLQIVGNCTSDGEMIPALQNSSVKYPWINDIVNIMMGIDNDTSKYYEGLSDEDIELKAFNMRALFWHDMHKIFVNISIQHITDKDGIKSSVINHTEGADALNSDFEYNCYNNKTIFNENGKPYKMVYNADGSFNMNNYNLIHSEIVNSNLFRNIPEGKVTDSNISLIEKALKSFGADISMENIIRLFSEPNAQKWAALKSVIFGFYNSNKNSNTALKSVSGEEKSNVYDAFREQYNILSALFADTSEGRDESSVYVDVDDENKRLFSRIFPNRIHTIFNRLTNKDGLSEQDYKDRLNEKYGHDWWYAAENPDGKTPVFTGVLRDLWSSKEDRGKIKIKTLVASKGISYSNEIDAQAEETRLNEFELNNKDGFTDYSVPTFSDTGASYYATMRYFNIHNTEQRQELLDRLVDVLKQEIRRINVVKERARINVEAYNNDQELPINTIACWDIEIDKGQIKESETDGSNFHFFPALNASKNEFLQRLNSLSNNPDAQKTLLERAVIYAMNEEMKRYIAFYNQAQVNQLPNSRHKESGNKQLIAYIDSILDYRKNNPLDAVNMAIINDAKNKLKNNTLLPEDFNAIKENVKNALISGTLDAQSVNNINLSIDSFKQDLSNLNKLEDYLWNSYYANTQIINLTIKDPAFLGTADKVQKRYKMYYSPVQTAYTTEYDLKAFKENGQLVETNEKLAKKTEYSLILVDDTIDEVYSFDNIKSLIDKKVSDGYLTKEQANEILANLSDIYAKTIDKRAEINLADAQCYRTLPSWQKCLNMIGKGYNKKMQQSINRLMNPKEYGDWSYEDFHNVWEIFKPFVASDMYSPSFVEDKFGSQYSTIGMPVMHKNAEFLLLAMYNQLDGVIKDNWKLKALNEFMVKHGIDKAQFESAVKLGSQGAININKCKTPEEVTSTLEIATGITGDMQAENGNKQVVHAIPFNDWGISTSMPEHLLDHPESSMGTQLMKIITEGLSEHPDKQLKVGDRTMTYKQWLEEYQALQMANLREDFEEVGKIFNNNEELVKYLKKQILTQNKYSHELLEHLELDENGNFKYPIIDPMLRGQFDALCASLIRNNVTKRKRRMGALPQIAAFGFEEDLQIRCTDRNGTLLRTKKEFEEQGSNIQGIETWEAYKEYCDHNATNIAYMEVYMPPFDTTLMRKINDACIYKEDVLDKNGKPIHRSGEFNHQLFNKLFNIDKKNPLNNKLKMGLANRVPTETKHSMIPIYVKGFLPAQNSSCVVVPAEWIAISDSDNDGDKLYCYFYHSKAVWDIFQMKKDWAEHYDWNYISKAKRDKMRASKSNYRTDDFVKSEELDAIWEAPSKFADKALEEFKKQVFNMYDKYCNIEPVEFKVKELERHEGESDISYQHRCEMESIESNSAQARNNRMLDLERAVLQTDENSAQVLIPGGFPLIKKTVKDTIKPLYNATKDFMSICNPATRTIQQIRNMAGANLIGIYANHRSFRPLIERAGCKLNNEYAICINNNESLERKNYQLTWSLSSEKNAKGEFISDNISNFSGASVDNAKDPLLSWIGQNTLTASWSMFLIHCGYTIDEVALFMNQPIIKKVVRDNLINGGFIDNIIKEYSKNLEQNIGSATNRGEVDNLSISVLKDQIKRDSEGILPTANDNYIQYVVLENLKRILPSSKALQNLITVTKADTQVGSLKSEGGENKAKLMLYDKIISEVTEDSYPIENANLLIVDYSDIKGEENRVPLSLEFRKLGVESIEDFTKDISMSFTKIVDKVLNAALNYTNGSKLNKETIEALTQATISYIFSQIPALNKGSRLLRFSSALKVLNDIKKARLLDDNMLIRDLIVNVHGDYYSKGMPFIQLKRLNNNYDATENYRRAWESLIVNSDKTVTVNGKTITYGQLSNLLFNYCFMVSGLTKKGKSFINCYPPAYINNIEGYVELLNNISDMDFSDEIANRIVEQYIANNPEDYRFVHRINKDKLDMQKFLDKTKVIPDEIRISDVRTASRELVDEVQVMGETLYIPYNYIYFSDSLGRRYLYKGVQNDEYTIEYRRVSVLGNTKNGFLEEYEIGEGIGFDDGVKSIIAANRNLYMDATIKNTIDKQVQDYATKGQEFTMKDMKDVFDKILSGNESVHIEMDNYNPETKDATGMKFCAII